MSIDPSTLFERAFFTEEHLLNATETIERARVRYEALEHAGATSFELVVPPSPDERWVRERLLRPTVYYCESEGRPIPKCPGVFLSLFVGGRLYCVTVAAVVEWAGEQLGLTVEDLRREYGTQEIETTLR